MHAVASAGMMLVLLILSFMPLAAGRVLLRDGAPNPRERFDLFVRFGVVYYLVVVAFTILLMLSERGA